MSDTVRQEVLDRMLFARSLQRRGDHLCEQANDTFSFAAGLVLLHDAADAALGAVAEHVGAYLDEKTYMMKYYKIIPEADKESRKVPYSSEVGKLNMIRNGIKHKGLFPDPARSAHYPRVIMSLLEDLCSTYFGVDLGSMSLSRLIRAQTVRDWIGRAEEQLAADDFENALVSVAHAMYYLAEVRSVWGQRLAPRMFPGTPEPPERITPITDTMNFTVRLLQYGIDPMTYRRFKSLTPTLVYVAGSQELERLWDSEYGHQGNWTDKNVRFCLEFCIDCALRFEREAPYEYELVSHRDVYDDVVVATEDAVDIWDRSETVAERQAGEEAGRRVSLRVLKKGESIVGQVFNRDSSLLEYAVISEDLRSEDGRILGPGWVSSSKVRLERREKQSESTVE